MGVVTIREFAGMRRDRVGEHTGYLDGALVTDADGTAIKTVTTVAATPVDSAALSSGTLFVEIDSTVNVRFAVRPKGRTTTLAATSGHQRALANTPKIVAVYPGAIINFLE
jgi:hypothetical protein